MSEQEVLYEAKLAKTGPALSRGLLLAMLLFGGFGLKLTLLADFPQNLFPAAWTALCLVGFGLQLRKFFPLRRNPGVFRISVDDYGLYVHSDAPSIQTSFSIVATDLHSLVRKTIKHSETADDHEYYIVTKSGKRHRIEDLLLAWPKLSVMDLFESIIERFHWVEIVEEVQP